jgi:uncharacterized RmlC-like cupin family protein
MGVTGVINRDRTVKDCSVEKGMSSEIIASRDECGSAILFYTYSVLEPGARTEPHVHDNCEIAWYLLKGRTLCAIGSIEDDDYELALCEQGTGGYVAPGELHMQWNVSDSDKAVLAMAYVGVNNSEDARGRAITATEALRGCFAERGLTL